MTSLTIIIIITLSLLSFPPHMGLLVPPPPVVVATIVPPGGVKGVMTSEMSHTQPVHRAARAGSCDCLAKLVAEDPESIHCVDGTGWTALHCAAHREYD